MTKVGQDLIQAASGADSIDALIERLREWPTDDDVEHGQFSKAGSLMEQAADALAKLRERDTYCDDAFRYYEESLDEADAEMAKLCEINKQDRDARYLELKQAQAEIAKLQARLEIDHYFVGPDMRRVEVPHNERDSQIDGIEARDCTIKMQDEQIAKLQQRVEKLRMALLDCVSFMLEDISGDSQKKGIIKEARSALGFGSFVLKRSMGE